MREFDLALDRIRLRAMLVITEAAAAPLDVSRKQIEADLAACEAALRTVDRSRSRSLGLGDDELHLLWCAVAVAVDPRVVPHAQVLGGPAARRGVTPALAAAILGLGPERARALTMSLGPRHPLLANGLLIPVDDGATVASRSLAVPARVANFLAGDDAPDDALGGCGGMVDIPGTFRHDGAQAESMKRLSQALAASGDLVVCVEGPHGAGRRTVVGKQAAPRKVVHVDVSRLAPTVSALEDALAALRREATLTGAIPLVADVDDLTVGEGDPAGAARLRVLARFLDELPGLAVVTSSQTGIDLGTQRRLLRVGWPVPDLGERHLLWMDAVGPSSAVMDLKPVARRYRLGPGGIRRAVATACLIGPSPGPRELTEGVRNNIAERMGGLASRVEVRQSWDDLVLAPDTLDQVNALVARVRHAHRVFDDWGFASKMPRGQGVAALFSGPPGTGKTMVAGLIARELDLELYQVDLSKVVSKWVGETEKQLGRVFEAAEAGHALLLFDEADALFAKRTTEVKSATDRYANLEVNYLLQRIESFGGITILTTNLDTAIDPALRRRLAANIVFWAPDLAERLVLWKRMIPAGAPVAPDIRFDELAEKFAEMSGANIRNAVLSAAFLAAAEDTPITQKHLERAAKGEYRAMGRVL